MNIARDPYRELGVGRDASGDDIKRAFRRRSKHAHPDAGGSSEQFHRLSQSYHLLMSPERKAKFDATGEFDDVKPPPNMALHIVSELMNQVISQASTKEVCEIDIFEKMRQHLDEQALALRGQLHDIERNRVNLERFAKKIRRKKGKNLVREMVLHEVAQLKQKLLDGERAIRDMAAAKALLEDYSFEADARQPSAMNGCIVMTVAL